MTTKQYWIALATVSFSLAGCIGKPAVSFPTQSLDSAAKAVGASGAYDTDGDGKADYFTFTNAAGRIDRIAYDTTGRQKPTEFIQLDQLPASRCRHLVLILDGFGYDVVKKFYDEGHLRYCNEPSRVIAPYPTLTDLSLEDALGFIPCRAFEAQYFDHAANKLVGGANDYLNSVNMPYDRLLDYRASMFWDAISYVAPWPVFGKEINDSFRNFCKSPLPEFLAYYVSSAGVGTAQGADGQVKCLERVEQLVQQAMWQTRGLTKITILADHGHSYHPATMLPFADLLTKKGWHMSDSLHKPTDVVHVQFGLETYASFNSLQPEKLAADLVTLKGVDLASYSQGKSVVVLDARGGKAVVHQKEGKYRYEIITGDPLRLKDILAKLTPDADGMYAGPDLFSATVTHDYPDPLARLWRAHFALAKNAPDVIVSLEDAYMSGAATFAGAVKIASTHGSLNRTNSTTFIMSSIAPLPPAFRSADIPANMKTLTGNRFPLRDPK